MGKLIVFDGMSTTGKSTVFKKLNADGQCVWFHEEDREHPTRIDERDAWENSERFRLMWHDRWKRFLSEADANDITYVFDGCIFHELERTFLRNGWAHSVIKELFSDLNELFSRHDVTLFLLCLVALSEPSRYATRSGNCSKRSNCKLFKSDISKSLLRILRSVA